MLGLIGKNMLSWTSGICVPRRWRFLQADWTKVREGLRLAADGRFANLVRIMVDADLKEVETKMSGGAAAVAVTTSQQNVEPRDQKAKE